MKEKVKLFFVLLFISGTGCLAQSVPIKASIRSEAGIPAALGNKIFKSTFAGVYSLSINPNYHLTNSLFVGPVATYRRFRVVPRKLADIRTVFDQFSYGLRVGYAHFYSDYASVGISFQAQMEQGHFFRVPCVGKDNYKYSSFSYAPQLFVNFLADVNFMLGATLSTTFEQHAFDPYAICLESARPILAEELKGNSSYLAFGFSLLFLFPQGGKELMPRSTELLD